MVCAGGGMREGSFSSYDGIMQRKRKKVWLQLVLLFY